jgi:hypothetical protein
VSAKTGQLQLQYDKAGLVLRVETVINNPEEFRARKQVLRDGKQRAEWVALRRGVAYLFRYREISLHANARYLDAMAAVDDPTAGKKALQRLTTTKKDAAGRSCPGNNAVGATRRHLVQEPDGRRALHARLYEPRHPIAAERYTLATRVRRRPLEGQREGRPMLQAAARARADRQDPAHPALACHRLWAQGHGHHDIPARAPLPQRLLRRHALNFFAGDKEVHSKRIYALS